MSDFNTPDELIKAYEDGFVGGECDPEDVMALLGELPMPLFGAAAWDLDSSGAGKLSTQFKSLLKFVKDFVKVWTKIMNADR